MRVWGGLNPFSKILLCLRRCPFVAVAAPSQVANQSAIVVFVHATDGVSTVLTPFTQNLTTGAFPCVCCGCIAGGDDGVSRSLNSAPVRISTSVGVRGGKLDRRPGDGGGARVLHLHWHAVLAACPGLCAVQQHRLDLCPS